MRGPARARPARQSRNDSNVSRMRARDFACDVTMPCLIRRCTNIVACTNKTNIATTICGYKTVREAYIGACTSKRIRVVGTQTKADAVEVEVQTVTQ